MIVLWSVYESMQNYRYKFLSLNKHTPKFVEVVPRTASRVMCRKKYAAPAPLPI